MNNIYSIGTSDDEVEAFCLFAGAYPELEHLYDLSFEISATLIRVWFTLDEVQLIAELKREEHEEFTDSEWSWSCKGHELDKNARSYVGALTEKDILEGLRKSKPILGTSDFYVSLVRPKEVHVPKFKGTDNHWKLSDVKYSKAEEKRVLSAEESVVDRSNKGTPEPWCYRQEVEV